MTEIPIDRQALRDARADFEAIRLLLVSDLNEPGRSAFWKAVGARTRIDELLAALPPTTDGVRVAARELEWHPIMPGSTSSVADAGFGEYTVEHYTEAATGDGWLAIYEDNRKLGYFGTEAEAKAAAQADYAARIMSAVVVTHPAPVAAQPAEGWVLVPREPTEAMLDAIMDPQSPFIGRRKMDKSGGEVVEQTNEDWRNTIGGEDDFRHHGDFKNEREAMQQADRLSAAWRLSNAIAAAPSNPGTSKVENSRST